MCTVTHKIVKHAGRSRMQSGYILCHPGCP